MNTQPLAGLTVLVTRPRETAGPIVAELQRLGATVLHDPVLSIGPPPDPAAVADVLSRLGQFAWLVFVSQTGVRTFVEQLGQQGRPLDVAKERSIAAIGPATAAALTEAGLPPSIVAEEATSEGLLQALGQRTAGQRVLLIRANRGRDVLRPALAAAARVEQVAFYQQVESTAFTPATVAALQARKVGVCLLTSSESARLTVRLMREAGINPTGWPRLVAISPVTAAVIREEGGTLAAVAASTTTEGLIESVMLLAKSQSEPHGN